MARGRMIDRRISNSKKIGKVSDKARVLWFMIYPHLDREGRIAFDDLDDLKTEIIPKFKNWTIKKIADVLNELAEVGLIILYPHRYKIAMQFEKFDDFQVGFHKEREAISKIVAPGETPETSGNFRISPALSISRIKLRKEVIEDPPTPQSSLKRARKIRERLMTEAAPRIEAARIGKDGKAYEKIMAEIDEAAAHEINKGIEP